MANRNFKEDSYAKRVGLERDGDAWKLNPRSDIGFIDMKSNWAKLRMNAPIVAPDNLSSDDDIDSENENDIVTDEESHSFDDEDEMNELEDLD